jgi:signal transduction histidine kinase
LARQYEGTGLGLSICDGLAKLHGGRLEIDSAPNQGTAVTVLFPPQRLRSAGPVPAALRA